MEATPGFEPGNKGFADLCLSQLGDVAVFLERKTGFEPATLSLARRYSTTEPLPLNDSPQKWWAMTGSNRRHLACKASALPAELIALNTLSRKNNYIKLESNCQQPYN